LLDCKIVKSNKDESRL